MDLRMSCRSARTGVKLLRGLPSPLLQRLAPASNFTQHQSQLLQSQDLTRTCCSHAGATRSHRLLRQPVTAAGSSTTAPEGQHRRSVTEISSQSSRLSPAPASLSASLRNCHSFSTSTTSQFPREQVEEPIDPQIDPVHPQNEQNPGTMPSAETTTPGSDAYAKAFNNNSLWRRSLAETNPDIFDSMRQGQSPQILWIGCADSRCPETTILGLNPGEIFCHRNIANILVNTDMNSLSVIQYGVQYLKVKHIIICGHTSCGGIAAALGNKKLGLIDTWLMPLRALRQDNLALLDSLDETDRGLKMVELNVRSGVKVLLANPIVIDAMHERGLQVHGLIYNVGTGELRELDIEEEEEVVKSRVTAFKTED